MRSISSFSFSWRSVSWRAFSAASFSFRRALVAAPTSPLASELKASRAAALSFCPRNRGNMRTPRWRQAGNTNSAHCYAHVAPQQRPTWATPKNVRNTKYLRSKRGYRRKPQKSSVAYGCELRVRSRAYATYVCACLSREPQTSKTTAWS